MKTLLFAALLPCALPAVSQELHELDKGKGGHEPPAPTGSSSDAKRGSIFIDEPTSHVEYHAQPRAFAPPVIGKPVIDSAAALKRVVDSLSSGKKVEASDLDWAKGVVAGELQRLADSGDAELKFRAELSCAADAKKGLKCSASEKYKQLLDAKKADYDKIKGLLDGQ